MLSEHEFDTGEVTLNYAEGPESGPPLMLLHGNTGNWHGWEIFFPHLAPLWHLYACDLRGHGKSRRVADCYRVPDYVRDIVAFLRDAAEPVVLLGHSLGALRGCSLVREPIRVIQPFVEVLRERQLASIGEPPHNLGLSLERLSFSATSALVFP